MNWLILQQILIPRIPRIDPDHPVQNLLDEEWTEELPQEDVKLFTDLFDPDKANQLTEEQYKDAVLDEILNVDRDEEDHWCTSCILRFFCRAVADLELFRSGCGEYFNLGRTFSKVGRRIKSLFTSCSDLFHLFYSHVQDKVPGFHWIIWITLWCIVATSFAYLIYFLYINYGNATMAEVVKEWELIKGWLI